MNYSRSTKQIFIEQFHVWGFDQCQQRKMYSVINSNKKGLWLGLLHDFHRTELCILVICFFLYFVEFAWFVVYFFSIYLPSWWIQKQTECPRIVFVAQFPRIQVNNIFLHDSYHSFIWRRSVYDWFSSLYSLTSISNASDRSAWISNWMWCGAKLRLIWYRDRISMAIQNARR